MSLYDASKKQQIKDLWNKAVILPEKKAEVERVCKKLISNKERYAIVSKETNVPWYVIAMLHNMEAGCDFKSHLHNGDSLNARTVQVPAGRPVKGNPPFTWEDSAIDALQYDHLANETDWSIEHILYLTEKFNGFGYEKHGKLSAYVWAATSVQTKGKYVKDGVWDDNAISSQIGCAAMLSMLISLDEVSNDLPASTDRIDTVPVDSSSDNHVVRWVLNQNNSADVRGYNIAGKCICYLDTGCNFDVLLKSVALQSLPNAKYSIEALPPKPPVVVAPPKIEPKPIPKETVMELKNGITNPAVIELKKLLNEKFGSSLTTEGSLAPVFGDKTEVEVKRVQAILNIPADGVIHAADLEMIRSYQKPEYPTEPTPPIKPSNANLALIEEEKKWIGVKEKGGNNKGPEVEKFQKAVDNKASSEAWCMAFQMFCIKEVEAALGIKSQIFRSEHCLTVWQKSPKSMRIEKPEPGCVIIWQHGTSTSGHTGIFTGFDKNGNLLTIEGNTNGAGSRDGDGVFSKTRNPVADGELKVVGFLRVFS